MLLENLDVLLLVETGAIFLISLLVSLLSPRALSILTYPFSFKTFGIRKIRRFNRKTDTIANIFLTVSGIFCIVYPIIPFFYYIYGLFLTYTWLCALSRVPRMSGVKKRSSKAVVSFFITLVYGFGLLSSLGLFNHLQLIQFSIQFVKDIQAGIVLNVMYPLTNAALISWIAQGVLMMIPLWYLWSQFKTMRLENTFQASNLGFYIVKSILITLIVALMGMYASTGIMKVYRIEDTKTQTEAGVESEELIEDIDEDIQEEKEDVKEETEEKEIQDTPENEDQPDEPEEEVSE